MAVFSFAIDTRMPFRRSGLEAIRASLSGALGIWITVPGRRNCAARCSGYGRGSSEKFETSEGMSNPRLQSAFQLLRKSACEVAAEHFVAESGRQMYAR